MHTLEFKITLFLFFMVACVFGLFMRNYVRERAARKESERQLLLTRWKSAREERRWWYEDHKAFFNFYHPEYQRLWEIEIGAEALYIFHEQGFLGKFARHAQISWSDYKAEKYCFDTQKT